jgi:hypothetical protein
MAGTKFPFAVFTSIFVSFIVTSAFYLFRYKPGSEKDILITVTFIILFFTLFLSGLHFFLRSFQSIHYIKRKYPTFLWNMIKNVAYELLLLILGLIVLVLVGGIIFGIIAPDLMKKFIEEEGNITYIFMVGFSLWFIVLLVDTLHMIRRNR